MIVWIAGIGAFICLIYYGIITIYAGFSTSFSWIWLAGAFFLFLIVLENWYRRGHPKKVPLWIPVSMYTFFAASLVIFCVVEMLIFLGAAGSDTGRMDYVIVLGARVREEGPSNSLRVRLDKAVEYSKSNPGTIFILSGGQGLDEPEAEASVIYDYLLAHGVPAERMALENVSTSTVENIAYSKVLIEHMEKERREELQKQRPSVAPGPYLEVEEKPLQIGILTSNYHVFRAKKIGEKWGLPNLHGIAAKSDLILFPHLCVRECIAILKDQLMGNM